MKNITGLFYCILCIFLLISFSCSDSCDSICEPEDPRIFIRILSSLDETDLVYGENKVYDVKDLKFYDLDSSDSTFYNLETTVDANSGNILTFDHVDFIISRVFIDYGNADIDTLDVTFGTSMTECCGTFRSLKTVFINDTQIFDGNNGGNFITIWK